MARITKNSILAFAKRRSGRPMETLFRKRPFTLEVTDGEITFYPASGRPFTPELDLYIAAFNRKPSFRPKHLPHSLWSRSYFLSLVHSMLGRKDPRQGILSSTKLESAVNKLRKSRVKTVPIGQRRPKKNSIAVVQYARDPEVKAWVLDYADGVCELCGRDAPFRDDRSELHLEVHHVKALGDGGPDTIDNAVAVCPNCHRACHLGRNKKNLAGKLLRQVARLIKYS